MVTPLQKKWFRIETGKDGDILSCEEVSAKGRAGSVVRYYEALDKAEACAAAKAWAENHRRNQRERSERYLSNPEKRSNRNRSERERRKKIRAGEHRPSSVPPLPAEEKLRRTKERNDRRNSRVKRAVQTATKILPSANDMLQIYQSIAAEFDSRTPREFRAWLAGKIVEFGGSEADRAQGKGRAVRYTSGSIGT